MDFTRIVESRRMVRTYQADRPVERSVVSELLRLGMRAPSAGYSQGWQFVVLDDITSRDAFWAATADGEEDSWLRGMRTAPTLILCLSDKRAYLDRYAEADKGWSDRDEARWPVPYWDCDVAMAAMIVLLGAVDAELSSCFFGVPPAQVPRVRAAFEIPDRLNLVGVISLGYPAEDRRSPSLRRGRRPFDECVGFGRYAGPSD